MSPQRCGNCHNCQYVNHEKHRYIPNPPFTHATDDLVMLWNQFLADHPCEAWDTNQLEAVLQQMQSLSPSIRPYV